MAGTWSTPYASARSWSIARLSTSTVIWSESSATSRTSCSFCWQSSAASSDCENTTSLTGPPILSNSLRTAAWSRALRMGMASLYPAAHRGDGAVTVISAGPPLCIARLSASPNCSAPSAENAASWALSAIRMRSFAPGATAKTTTMTGTPRRRAVSSSPAVASSSSAPVKQTIRRSRWTRCAAIAAGRAKPALSRPLDARSSRGATACHASATSARYGPASTVAIVPAGSASPAGRRARALEAVELGDVPVGPVTIPEPRRQLLEDGPDLPGDFHGRSRVTRRLWRADREHGHGRAGRCGHGLGRIEPERHHEVGELQQALVDDLDPDNAQHQRMRIRQRALAAKGHQHGRRQRLHEGAHPRLAGGGTTVQSGEQQGT